MLPTIKNISAMDASDPNQFLGLPAAPLAEADAVILPVPLEKTVSYGTGTWRAPRAILDASCQVETFDEQTQVDFAVEPRLHTLPMLLVEGDLPAYLAAIKSCVARLRGKFVLCLGGEHSLTYGAVIGLAGRAGAGAGAAANTKAKTCADTDANTDAHAAGHTSAAASAADAADTGTGAAAGADTDLQKLTIVQIDAHADLIDSLEGRRWCHGTVMRRLWEQGCRLVQIGVRSLSRKEYELAQGDPRINTFFAHELPQRWDELLATLDALEGPVYLTLDVDGLDPGVIPSTGTPQPGGLSWFQTVEIIQHVAHAPQARLIGADVVELVASPHAPGCDLAAARLASKLLAWWWKGRKTRS